MARFSKEAAEGVKGMVTPNTHFQEYKDNFEGKNLNDEKILDVLAKVPNLLKKPMLTDGSRILQGTADSGQLAEFTGLAKK